MRVTRYTHTGMAMFSAMVLVVHSRHGARLEASATPESVVAQTCSLTLRGHSLYQGKSERSGRVLCSVMCYMDFGVTLALFQL